MANCKISNKKRAQIIARFHAGDTLSDISKTLKVPYHSVCNAVQGLERCDKLKQRPECPSCFKNLDEAALTAIACKNTGFDSDFTKALCIIRGCSVKSLEDIANWFSMDYQLQTNSDRKAVMDKIFEFGERLGELKQMLDETSELRQAKKEAMAKAAGHLFMLEKSDAEMLAETIMLNKFLDALSKNS